MSYEDQVEDPNNIAMRLASGQIDDQRPLVTFLYLLGRDELSLGAIEQLIMKAAEKAVYPETMFTNGWLAQWAQYTAEKLARE